MTEQDPLQLAALARDVKHMMRTIESLDQKVDALERQAHCWKGGLAVLIALGGVAAIAVEVISRWWSVCLSRWFERDIAYRSNELFWRAKRKQW